MKKINSRLERAQQIFLDKQIKKIKKNLSADVIKKHDKVKLKSGGPIMTVTDIRGNEIECVWKNGCDIFYPWTLNKV